MNISAREDQDEETKTGDDGVDNNPPLFRSVSMQSGLKAISISPSLHPSPKTMQNPPKKLGIVTTTTSIAGWARDKLQKLGYYHPVNPSHESFPKNLLEEMLSRLTQCFRSLSCRVTYEDKELGAECLTMEQVEFHVNLLEKDSQTILIELQRRSGDSYVFHHEYAQPILATVRGVRGSDTQGPMERHTASLLDNLTSGATEEDITTAMELAMRLVCSDRLDARQLGIESLVSLTDTQVTGWTTASTVARGLVMPTDETSREIANVMLRYLLDDKESDLSYMALKAWSNIWQVAAADTESPLESFCDVLCPADILMHSLMNRVDHFEQQPHEATLALRGLESLCRQMPQLRSFVTWPTIEQANAMSSTAALEQASHRFLEVH